MHCGYAIQAEADGSYAFLIRYVSDRSLSIQRKNEQQQIKYVNAVHSWHTKNYVEIRLQGRSNENVLIKHLVSPLSTISAAARS